MSDEQTEQTEQVEETAEQTEATEAEETAGGQDDAAPQEDKPLGPRGEKALQAEKEKRKEEARKRREAEAELERLRNGDDKAAEAAREAEKAALAKANARILRSEIKAAAAGKFADLSDVVDYFAGKLDQFDVDENGDVDEAEIASAVDDLLKKKPHWAAQGGKPKFQGTGDGGSRKGSGRPSQLNREDLKRMSPEAIVKAKAEGRLNEALGINR